MEVVKQLEKSSPPPPKKRAKNMNRHVFEEGIWEASRPVREQVKALAMQAWPPGCDPWEPHLKSLVWECVPSIQAFLVRWKAETGKLASSSQTSQEAEETIEKFPSQARR